MRMPTSMEAIMPNIDLSLLSMDGAWSCGGRPQPGLNPGPDFRSAHRVDEGVGSGRLRPDDLPRRLAFWAPLPLRDHHLMAHLQAMLGRIGSELDGTEEGRCIGSIQRIGDLGRIERAGFFDCLLQNETGGVPAGGVVAGLGAEFVAKDLGKVLRPRAEVRLVLHLWSPLRRHGDADGSGS